MNKDGARAQSHWKTWLPNRYAQIEDPSSFFSTLGTQVSEQITALDLAGPDRPTAEFLARVGQRKMARMQAEEMVLREWCSCQPRPRRTGTSRTSLPAAWAIPSALGTVAAVAAQERELI